MGINRVDLGGGIAAAFTDRGGGVSAAPYDSLNLSGAVGDRPAAVAENRRRLAAHLGLVPERMVWMRQAHGGRVREVTAPRDADGTELDAVVTTEPGLALGVLVADCVPVLIADPVAGVVAAVHAGRTGTVAGIVPAVVAAMTAGGAQAARLTAVIGPAVCGRCYEVPARLRASVAATIPETWHETREGKPSLDLSAGVAAQLRRAGVRRLHQDARCTMETPELYSYRRDDGTGRFAGVIWLTGVG